MVKKMMAGGLIMVFLAGAASAFNPEGGDPDFEKGKAAFGECKKCHDGGKASKLSPNQKTKKQWSRFFENDFEKMKKKMPDWDKFGYKEDFLETVHRFLVDHALDSDKPQTCD